MNLLTAVSASLVILSSVASVWAQPSVSEPPFFTVWIFAGQSNMVGNFAQPPTESGLSPQPNIRFFNGNSDKAPSQSWIDLQYLRFTQPTPAWAYSYGPELAFGRTLDAITPNDHLAFIKYAVNGTSLADNWLGADQSPNKCDDAYLNCYEALKATVVGALRQLPGSYRLAGIVWMQGESDARDLSWARSYKQNLETLVVKLRTDLSTPNLKFVYGRIHNSLPSDAFPHSNLVRSAQLAIAYGGKADAYMSNVHMVGTDDLPLSQLAFEKDIHFLGQGIHLLGGRFANAFDSMVTGDYDGDGKTDFGMWRPTDGAWVVRKSSSGGEIGPTLWGSDRFGDKPVPEDYDGDGRNDYAVWRPQPTDSPWIILSSATGKTFSVGWGSSTEMDIPVPGDYDGDKRADYAVWRRTESKWLIRHATGEISSIQFGASSLGDQPVPGDYDGDNKTDLAVWRPMGTGSSQWWIRSSITGETYWVGWGLTTEYDVTAPGDYDGDGCTDLAVWRPTNATWYVKYATRDRCRPARAMCSVVWGASRKADRLAQGDYDGRGRTDFAVWRPEDGLLYTQYAEEAVCQ